MHADTHVAIFGAGAAGIEAALALDSRFRVTLIGRDDNYYCETHMLTAAAAAAAAAV